MLLAELSLNADFGFGVGKNMKGGGLLPLRAEDFALQKMGGRGALQMNILDPDNIDENFQVKGRHKWLEKNEHWFIGKSCLCMRSDSSRIGKLEIRDSSTATKSRDTQEKQ